MILEEIRREFLVFVLFEKEEQIQEDFQNFGIQYRYSSSTEELFGELSKVLPHIVLFDPKHLDIPIKDFFEKTLQESPETLFIALGSSENFSDLKRFSLFGLFEIIERGENQREKIIWSMDRAFQQLYLQYQNEQLLSEGPIEESQKQKVSVQGEGTLDTQFFQKMYEIENYEELLKEFLSWSCRGEGAKGLYFKYVPEISSLVLAECVGLPFEKIKDIGVRVEAQTHQEVEQILESIDTFPPFRLLLKQGLKVQEFVTYPLSVSHRTQGLFLFYDGNMGEEELFKVHFSHFQVCYRSLFLGEKIREIEVKDPITQVYNRRYFTENLEKEISRARRLSLPVSLILLEVDHFPKILKKYGETISQILLRKIAIIIKETSRVNDVVAYLGDHHFGIIATHSENKGAAIRSERLRRILREAKFRLGPAESLEKVTVSFGVSEYPSFCKSPTELLQTAKKALKRVKKQGGDRVCLAAVNEEFQPDYRVSEAE